MGRTACLRAYTVRGANLVENKGTNKRGLKKIFGGGPPAAAAAALPQQRRPPALWQQPQEDLRRHEDLPKGPKLR